MEVEDKYYFDCLFQGHKNPKPYSFRLFGINVFSIYYHKRLGWFRLFGKGLKWKDITVHPLIFSERNGYVKYLKIGKWSIGLLKKQKY